MEKPHNTPAPAERKPRPAASAPIARKPARPTKPASAKSAADAKTAARPRPANLAAPKPPPMERYRVEGIGRKGVIRFVKVVGVPGSWRITGLGGLNVEVKGRTVAEAVKNARRQIGFRPIVIKPMEPLAKQ